eukprot:gene6686-6909_t
MQIDASGKSPAQGSLGEGEQQDTIRTKQTQQPKQPQLQVPLAQQQQQADLPFHLDCEESRRSSTAPRQLLFQDLQLPGPLLEGLRGCNMTVVTPVQEAALMPILSGRNALVQSPTGTGKTLAYLVPLMAQLQPWVNQYKQGAHALVLAPTQELCMQVVQVARSILLPTHKRSVLGIIGGVNHVRQLEALQDQRPGLLVATPGRLLKVAAHLGMFKKVLAPPGPDHKPVLVLEEADKLLMMQDFRHFIQELARPASKGGKSRLSSLPDGSGSSTGSIQSPMEQVLRSFQVIMVSASIKPRALADLTSWTDTNPAVVVAQAPTRPGLQQGSAAEASPVSAAPGGPVSHNAAEDAAAHQELVAMLPGNLVHLMLGYDLKDGVLPSLKRCLKAYLGQGKKVLAFVGSNKRALEIQQRLQSKGMNKFNAGEQQVLLASDAFGLGLDFKHVDVVVQVEFLAASIRQYVHRAGRTGRMGSGGTVISIIPYRFFKAHRKQLKAIKVEPQGDHAMGSYGSAVEYGL